MLRSFKKAGLLVGVLACTLLLQGCIAQIMSAAGGILAGLGQAFGGQTGQILGQIGRVLGGVGQAFGQQQQGIAGQLAGAAGQIPGLNGQIPGLNGQIPGINPGQIPGINPGQIPGINPGQNGNPLGQLFPPQNGGTVQLPQAPGSDIAQRALNLLAQQGIRQPTAQQVQAAVQQLGVTDPNQIAAVTQQIGQQLIPANGLPPNLIGANGSGAPAPIPVGGIVNQNTGAGINLGVQIPGAAGAQFNGALQATQGVLNLINIFRTADNSGGGSSPAPTFNQTPVQTISGSPFDAGNDFGGSNGEILNA